MLTSPLDTLQENQVVSKFLVDSNKAVTFKLIRSVEDIDNEKCSFQPGMSHQIFGAKVCLRSFIPFFKKIVFQIKIKFITKIIIKIKKK